MKKNKKKLQKLLKRVRQTQQVISNYYTTKQKLFENMLNKIGKIWGFIPIFALLIISIQSCNVTRKVTTESSYYQRGDTAITITTKTIETYDATKKM